MNTHTEETILSKSIQENLDGCLYFSIKRLERALDKYTEDAFRKLGMSHSYALVLFILSQENGKRCKDLAEILCIAPPSLSKIVYKLAQQELVTITQDGRIKHIYITDKGRELVPEILQIFNETREKFMEMNQDYNLSGFIKDVNYLREKLK
ncbi:MarR family winged helix-turn-helix transcriptional regulator [Streptococcus equinus]|uniref:MarR family winged helix-turn-helix transcriptional regulator n=1 Tax=Streptococcus equinus TaxID=1335 RepID=UPI003BF79588